MLDDLTWGVAITTWGMEKTIGAAHLAPRGSAVAAILCGTIAGCGGGLLCDTASLMSTEWKLKTPQALRTVSFAPTTALCCCVLAYALRDPHNVVSPFMLHNAGVAFVPLQPEDVMVVAATLTCSVSTIRSTFEKLFENGKIV
uniref:Uncharacterized protein n=2 Tax=Chrysotila carterae TaxID=13221 RepID=A0A7S4C1P3_CHRCT